MSSSTALLSKATAAPSCSLILLFEFNLRVAQLLDDLYIYIRIFGLIISQSHIVECRNYHVRPLSTEFAETSYFQLHGQSAAFLSQVVFGSETKTFFVKYGRDF